RVGKRRVRRGHAQAAPHRSETRLDEALAQLRSQRAEVQRAALQEPVARLALDASEELAPYLGLAEEQDQRPPSARVELVPERLEEVGDRVFAEAAHALELVETEHDGHVGEMEQAGKPPIGSLFPVERLGHAEQLQLVVREGVTGEPAQGERREELARESA